MSRTRTVLVVGGVSGIGRAIAEAFSSDGCKVWITARTQAEIDQAPPSGDLTAAILDVTQPKTIDHCLELLPDSRLDCLVNAAGILLRDGREFSTAGFEEVIDVNLNGTMRTCLAAREMLAASQGCVINIASMLSFFGSGHAPAYSASKGGIAQLTKSLAIAWAPRGIRVNAIAPGWIKTALTAPLYSDPARSEGIVNRTPMGRWGEPADVAGAALFLASPAAAFITGVILPVDGGYSVC